jgi:hypothetical protein
LAGSLLLADVDRKGDMMEGTCFVSDGVSWRRHAALATLLLTAALLSGCAVISRVAPVFGEIQNLSDPECFHSFSSQLASALEEQGETPEDSAAAAGRAARLLPYQDRVFSGPFFQAVSVSGISYGGYLEPRNSGACVLRLYERRKEGAVVQNTITFFATRHLESCTCSWVVYSERTTYY